MPYICNRARAINNGTEIKVERYEIRQYFLNAAHVLPLMAEQGHYISPDFGSFNVTSKADKVLITDLISRNFSEPSNTMCGVIYTNVQK